MKPFILLISIALTSLFAIVSADANIGGTWVMEQGDSAANPPVFRIKMGEGIWQGTVDMPGQQIYDRKIHSISVDGDSLFITVYKDGPVISAKMTGDGFISGMMKGESREDVVLLRKN